MSSCKWSESVLGSCDSSSGDEIGEGLTRDGRSVSDEGILFGSEKHSEAGLLASGGLGTGSHVAGAVRLMGTQACPGFRAGGEVL